MLIDTGPKCYVVHDFKVKVTDLESLYEMFMLFFFLFSFFFFFLQLQLFAKPSMKLIETGPNFYMVSSPTQYMTFRLDHRHSFSVKFLSFMLNLNLLMDCIHFWHEDRTLSKLLRSAIPIPA